MSSAHGIGPLRSLARRAGRLLGVDGDDASDPPRADLASDAERVRVARARDEARELSLEAQRPPDRARTRQATEDRIVAASVEHIHQGLFYVLELLKRSLELHTVALLWLDERGERFSIKEVCSDSDAIVPGPIAAGVGAPSAIAKELRPLHVARPRPELLPYYASPQPVGAFLGVPVVDEDEPRAAAPDRFARHLRGVLCADRLVTRVEQGAPVAAPFDARDQQLLRDAAREIVRVVAAERLYLAVERRKSDMERLLRASDTLRSANGEDEVYASAFRAARELCEFDLAAFTRVDAHGRQRVVAATGDGAHEIADLVVEPGEGLVDVAVRRKHALPAEGAHERELSVFGASVGTGTRLRAMESVLVLPLIAGGEARGAFVLCARAPRRFVRERRDLLGVLGNQIAVAAENAERFREMERMAMTDGLTGLLNHRAFQERLSDLLSRADRSSGRVSLLLTDVDHFKKVNDTHGHPTGDRVLKQVAAICHASVRKVDVAARYGGEEFALVLAGTDRDGARTLAERVRREVESTHFGHTAAGPLRCTISIGMATWPDDGADKKTLIAAADAALYVAKRSGRNRTVAAHEASASPATAGPARG